ncbi:mRNA surveillance protein Pelota [Ignicoccus pacificus DSM 13166]|uniref:Protein pelota homolog n=1 Tax=Ignicoccus pacificus DSM 13166 TaxID=940294 RepID=A0A977KA59_9CREN|nr:mRNA surveillance protein Pelota [Ignicoccus pacificus DSM 13166]
MKMRVLEVNESKGEVRLRIEDEEDLWDFYTILREGDMLRAKTVRSISAGSSKEKVPMILTIKVTGAEFQPFTNVIRVKGIVVEGPERFGLKGSHHAIKVYPGRELVLIRENGVEDLVKKIESLSKKKPKIAVLAVDYDDYSLAIVRGQGIEWVFEGSMRIPGKADENRERIASQRVTELVKNVESELKKRDVKQIVVVGPGFFKEKVAEELRKRGLEVKVDSASSGDRAGVLEALRRGSLASLAKELESLKALEVLEEVIKHIAKDDNLAVYGLDDCLFAAKANAVDTLLISDYLLHHPEEEVRRKAVELVETVEKMGGKAIIVPRDTEAGERLKALGDVVAMLRFPLEVG